MSEEDNPDLAEMIAADLFLNNDMLHDTWSEVFREGVVDRIRRVIESQAIKGDAAQNLGDVRTEMKPNVGLSEVLSEIDHAVKDNFLPLPEDFDPERAREYLVEGNRICDEVARIIDAAQQPKSSASTQPTSTPKAERSGVRMITESSGGCYLIYHEGDQCQRSHCEVETYAQAIEWIEKHENDKFICYPLDAPKELNPNDTPASSLQHDPELLADEELRRRIESHQAEVNRDKCELAKAWRHRIRMGVPTPQDLERAARIGTESSSVADTEVENRRIGQLVSTDQIRADLGKITRWPWRWGDWDTPFGEREPLDFEQRNTLEHSPHLFQACAGVRRSDEIGCKRVLKVEDGDIALADRYFVMLAPEYVAFLLKGYDSLRTERDTARDERDRLIKTLEGRAALELEAIEEIARENDELRARVGELEKKHVPTWKVKHGEASTGYNAAIFRDVYDDVVGVAERERLQKLDDSPSRRKNYTKESRWQCQTVNGLVSRIMNLRLMVAELEAANKEVWDKAIEIAREHAVKNGLGWAVLRKLEAARDAQSKLEETSHGK